MSDLVDRVRDVEVLIEELSFRGDVGSSEWYDKKDELLYLRQKYSGIPVRGYVREGE